MLVLDLEEEALGLGQHRNKYNLQFYKSKREGQARIEGNHNKFYRGFLIRKSVNLTLVLSEHFQPELSSYNNNPIT